MLLRADWQTRRTLSFLIFVIDMTKLLDFFTIKLSRSWLVKQVVHVARWLTESSRVLAVAGVVVCLFVFLLVIIIFHGNWITAKSEILDKWLRIFITTLPPRNANIFKAIKHFIQYFFFSNNYGRTSLSTNSNTLYLQFAAKHNYLKTKGLTPSHPGNS